MNHNNYLTNTLLLVILIGNKMNKLSFENLNKLFRSCVHCEKHCEKNVREVAERKTVIMCHNQS